MKTLLCYCLLFTFFQFSYSQVGVGTTSPTAEVEIETDNTGIPALELNPQTAPVGTADGQLSVIGDKLYMYDATRVKWLSVESTALQFGRNGNSNNTVMKKAGNSTSGNSSYLMPFNGTIVYGSIKTNVNSGAQNKQFQIRVRNGTANISTNNVNTVASEFISTTLDINFSAGDYIDIRIQNDGNGNVNNAVAIIWVKWRQ